MRTCSANCQLAQTDHATGFLFPAPGADITDGDTFTIDDGINVSVTFEFTTGVTTNIPITFAASDTRTAMRNRIVTAIDGVGPMLLVDAAAGSGSLVLLTHDRATAQGNNPIGEAGSAAFLDSFESVGLSGGQAGNCAAGVGCFSNADCASNVCSATLDECL